MDELALAALKEFAKLPIRADEEHLAQEGVKAAKKDAPHTSPEHLSRLFITVAANLNVMADVCDSLQQTNAKKIVRGLAGVYMRQAAILAEEAGLISPPPSTEPKNTAEFFRAMGLDEHDLAGSLKSQLESMGLPGDLFAGMTDDEIRASAAKAMGFLQ